MRTSTVRVQRDRSEDQVAAVLAEAAAGTPVREVCQRHGISELTFYRWKGRAAPREAKAEQRMRSLEEELRILRRLLAFQALEVEQIREQLERLEHASA